MKTIEQLKDAVLFEANRAEIFENALKSSKITLEAYAEYFSDTPYGKVAQAALKVISDAYEEANQCDKFRAEDEREEKLQNGQFGAGA